MLWFEFRQNNSGGAFVEDEDNGLGPHVWIEAHHADHANERAEKIGIYFDGVSEGVDCDCCGDRWSRTYDNGTESISFSFKWGLRCYPTFYIHPIEGNFWTVTGKEHKPC